MSYVANQYNYATPLSSVASLVSEPSVVADKRYFTLSNNVLDGSCYPISGDVGIWSADASNVNGVMNPPFVVTVNEVSTFNAIRLVGSTYSYPVAFTVKLFNGNELVYTITETNNSAVQYVHYLPKTIEATHYEISITKISKALTAARLYNVYNPAYIKRVDLTSIKSTDTRTISSLHQLYGVDTAKVLHTDSIITAVQLERTDAVKTVTNEYTPGVQNAVSSLDSIRVKTAERTAGVQSTINARDTASVAARVRHDNLTKIFGSVDTVKAQLRELPTHVSNAINVTSDEVLLGCTDSSTFALPTNVHTRMKESSRRIYGKVYITYTDPMLDSASHISGSGYAYNSVPDQLLDHEQSTNRHFFNLYENDLSGSYVVSDANSQVGWVSNVVSNASGEFDGPNPYVRIDSAAKPAVNLNIVFDASRGAIPVDFTVTYVKEDGSTMLYEFVDNTESTVVIEQSVPAVTAIIIEVSKLSKAGYPVVILDVPIMSTLEYIGYQDRSDLINIDLLEELTYEDDIEALGGISANVITVSLDNSDKTFYFNNKKSIVASSLKRNRKIVPWLGVEVTEGEIEWYTLGTFWSYRWDVPVESLVAKVVGFDTIGLLDKTQFSAHAMQRNKSIGQLIEYVLNDAKQQLDFISYEIDAELYDIVIPYAWFDNASHTAALRKISKCYPMHIYCNRDGVICAAPQKLHMDNYYDVWSDDTNVISKRYNSLYTALPNILNVAVKNPVEKANDTLVEDALTFNVSVINSRTLNFTRPYISGIVVTIDCDSTVQYTYTTYSWGIVVNFTGVGNVRSIKCSGTSLDISYSVSISRRDEEGIRANGAIKRDIASDFIQTADLAVTLIDRITSLSEYDKYDVYVEYRGDIALSINDPILLRDGIAPDNRYNIKRHSLFWDGSLTGSAHLNT